MIKPPSAPTWHLRDLLPHGAANSWHSLPRAEEVLLTYSGRSAIYQYLLALKKSKQLHPKRTWVLAPAFQCPTVIDPILHAGFNVRFYTITEKLTIDQQDFLGKLDDSCAVALCIRFFGMGDIPNTLRAAVRQSGVRLMHDCSHSFLNSSPLTLAGADSDVAIYSFWKLLPSSNIGGGVLLNEPELLQHWPKQDRVPLQATLGAMRTLLTEVKDNLYRLPARQMAATATHEAMPAIRKTYETAYPYDRQLAACGITRIAKLVLSNTDLKILASQRRSNFNQFVQSLPSSSEFSLPIPELGERDVPWGMPLMLRRRYERDYLLRAHGIPLFSFGEVLHPLLFESAAGEPHMLDVSRHLSENLIAISVHQQLTQHQMQTYGQTASRFFSHLN